MKLENVRGAHHMRARRASAENEFKGIQQENKPEAIKAGIGLMAEKGVFEMLAALRAENLGLPGLKMLNTDIEPTNEANQKFFSVDTDGAVVTTVIWDEIKEGCREMSVRAYPHADAIVVVGIHKDVFTRERFQMSGVIPRLNRAINAAFKEGRFIPSRSRQH